MPEAAAVAGSKHVMGTVISVDVRDADISPLALDEVFSWFRRVDETFSTYKPDSQISRLARGELTLADCDADVAWVLATLRGGSSG